MSPEEKSVKFKLVLVGNPFVGKSTLRRSYLGEKFTSNYIITLGADFSFVTIKHESGTTLNVSLWDLAGQEQFMSTHPMYYRGALGALVIYSVVDRSSFEVVGNWIEEFYKGTNQNDYPILIIGNKLDLIEDYDDVVTEEEETELKERLQLKYPNIKIQTIRTSAKNGTNVQAVFKSFTNLVLSWIENKTKVNKTLYKIDKNIEVNFPSALVMTMNQLTGPVTVASSPSYSSFNSDEQKKIHSQVVKLIASLDFEDIVFHSSITGSFPWTVPVGSLKYIAFVLENSRARGKKELFILGLNINREIFSIIDELKGILDGYLYSSMNEFARLNEGIGFDFVVAEFQASEHNEQIKHIEKLLLNLRVKAENAVEKWYESK